MGKFKSIVLIAVVALTVSASPAVSFASSCDSNAKDGKSMEARRQELYKDLNLTDAQKKLLEENKKVRREEMKSLFSQMREKKEAIRAELQKGELNTGRIMQINNELKILSAQMLDHKLEGILEVRKILAPEQFKKFMAKMDRREEHFKEKRD